MKSITFFTLYFSQTFLLCYINISFNSTIISRFWNRNIIFSGSHICPWVSLRFPWISFILGTYKNTLNTTSYLVTSLIPFQVLTQEFRNFLHQVNLELKVILIYSFSLTQSLVLFHFCVRLMITHIIYSFIVISTHFTWNDIFRPFMFTFPFPKCKVLYFSVTIHIFLHQNNTKNVFSFIFPNFLLVYCILFDNIY